MNYERLGKLTFLLNDFLQNFNRISDKDRELLAFSVRTVDHCLGVKSPESLFNLTREQADNIFYGKDLQSIINRLEKLLEN